MKLLERSEVGTTCASAVRSHSHVPAWLHRVPSFLVVGAVATIGYALLYLALRSAIAPQVANAVALVASTVLSTDLNRRFTFGVRRRATLVPHQALGLGVLLTGLGMTAGSLWLLAAVAPGAGWIAELVVLALANAAVGTVRFVSFSLVMHEEPAPAT